MPSELKTEAYRQTIRELSDLIVEGQWPIRILDAIKWDDDVEKAFFASGCMEQRLVDWAYYENRPLAFDPVSKRLMLETFVEEYRRYQQRTGQLLRRRRRPVELAKPPE